MKGQIKVSKRKEKEERKKKTNKLTARMVKRSRTWRPFRSKTRTSSGKFHIVTRLRVRGPVAVTCMGINALSDLRCRRLKLLMTKMKRIKILKFSFSYIFIAKT